jgi:hypothetical protein
VILAAGLRALEDYPERYRELATFEYTGDSYIIDPRGEVIAGPARGETILTATVTLEAVYAAKVACDVGGHYSRPDLLQLLVNRQPQERLIQRGSEEAVVSPGLNGSANGTPFAGSARSDTVATNIPMPATLSPLGATREVDQLQPE